MYQLIANVTIFPGHLTKIFARGGGRDLTMAGHLT